MELWWLEEISHSLISLVSKPYQGANRLFAKILMTVLQWQLKSVDNVT
jgi:hypothetical protein